MVAEFGDVQVMSDEVLDAYNAEVNRQLLNGQDVSASADSLLEATLQLSLIHICITRAVLCQEALSLGCAFCQNGVYLFPVRPLRR